MCIFGTKRIYTMLWPAWHRQAYPQSQNRRHRPLSLKCTYLQLDVLCLTNNYPSSHLLITNTCFSQSYKAYSVAEITFLKLFTADVFLPATFESSGKWRKFAVPADIFCATRGSALLYTDKNDDLKTDDLYIFLLHCAPGRLS
jgi:hypothetical protein